MSKFYPVLFLEEAPALCWPQVCWGPPNVSGFLYLSSEISIPWHLEVKEEEEEEEEEEISKRKLEFSDTTMWHDFPLSAKPAFYLLFKCHKRAELSIISYEYM